MWASNNENTAPLTILQNENGENKLIHNQTYSVDNSTTINLTIEKISSKEDVNNLIEYLHNIVSKINGEKKFQLKSIVKETIKIEHINKDT